MTIVAPSLLACDFSNLENEIKVLENEKNLWLHLDIMDGHFVPNLTFGHPVVKSFKDKTQLPLDAHFMVTNPDFYADNFKDLGIHNFTFHWEACHHHDRMIQKLKEIYPSVGISLNPSTPLEVVPDYILSQVDLVLLMSVNPGFGGQSFIEPVLQKVKELNERKHRLGAKFHIQVDGGVNDKNAKDLISNGATNLVAGSYIFKAGADKYNAQIESLR